MKIRAFARVLRFSRCAYPIHGLAMRIAGFHHRFGFVPFAETRHGQALQLFVRHIRHIDVEQPGMAV